MSGSIDLPIISKFDPNGIKKAQNALSGFKSSVGKLGAVVAGAFSVAAISNFVKSTVNAASDLEETAAAVGEVFGSAAAGLEKIAETAPQALGQTRQQFLDAAKQFGIFGQAAGLASQENAKFSSDLVKLATDLASFNNTSVDDAIMALGAGLRGESEPLRRYGVLLDDATLKARAMEMGIYDGNGALTQQERVLAAQQEIFAQTITQQGDFARTSDGLANSQRILTATFEDMKATVGAALLPAFTALAQAMVPIVNQLAPMLTEVFEELSPAFMSIAGILPQVMQAFMPLIPIIGQIAGLFADVLIAVLPVFVNLMERLVPIIATVVEAFVPLIEQALPILVDLLDMFILIALPIIESILPPLLILLEAWAPLVLEIISALTPLIKELLPLLTMTIEYIVAPALELFASMLTGLPAAFQYLQDSGLIPSSEAIRTWAEGLGNIIFGVRSFVAKAVNSMITSFVGLANGAIKTINAVIDAGRKLPGAFGEVYRKLSKLQPLNVGDFLIAEPGKFDNLIFPEVDVSGISDVGRRQGQMAQNLTAGINAGIFGNAPTAGSYINQAGERVYYGVRPFAEGGLVTGPTLGLIGEAGPEAVIPLNKAGMFGNTYNITVQAGVGDPVAIGRDVVNAIKRFERASGPVFASA